MYPNVPSTYFMIGISLQGKLKISDIEKHLYLHYFRYKYKIEMTFGNTHEVYLYKNILTYLI